MLAIAGQLLGQSNWIAELEGSSYGDSPTISYIEQDDSYSLLPKNWIEEFNTGIEYGFKNANVFSKIYPMGWSGGSYLSKKKGAHYLAKLDIQQVLLDGKVPEEYYSAKSADVFVLAILKVYDVIDGTLEIAKEITFEDKINPYDEVDEIAGHFRKEVSKTLWSRFGKITPVYKANIVEEKGGKLQSLFINKVNYARMLSPKYLTAYRVVQEINGMAIFEILGNLQATKDSKAASRVHLNAVRGKKEILNALNAEQQVYLTTKSLAK